MQALKMAYEAFKAARMDNERAYDAWEADLENEELEAESDRAYEAMWDRLNEFAAELESMTGGRIDQATAKKIARNPKYSGRFDDLMERIAWG